MNSEPILNEREIAEIENTIGYTFKNKELLINAFTHKSFANEENLKNGTNYKSYERLEFLGDSILNFIIAEDSYLSFDTADEGDLTRLKIDKVSKTPLSNAVKKMGLINYLKTSKGTKFEEKKISDIFESIVAAIYLDTKNFDSCRKFILDKIEYEEEVDYRILLNNYNDKLQYKFTESNADGKPLHKCEFEIDNNSFSGTGLNQPAAKKEACKKACEFLGIK